MTLENLIANQWNPHVGAQIFWAIKPHNHTQRNCRSADLCAITTSNHRNRPAKLSSYRKPWHPGRRSGHHILALQTLNTTIGYPKEKLRMLEEFRRQRAIGLYDGSFEPTKAEVEAINTTVIELKKQLEDWLKNNHQELL